MKTRRLFFALWPSDNVRHSIVEIYSQLPKQIKGPVIQPQNLHITLHFPGSVTEENKDCMHIAAQAVRSASFECNLDYVGYFSRAKIFWMGYQHQSVELVQLHRDLGESLAHCGYQSEPRQYKPHVTLMRKCLDPLDANKDFIIPWYVDEFVLVESVSRSDGVHYQVIEKYPLA